MDKYKDLTQDIFSELLSDIIHDMSANEILAVPGVHSIMAEELNNEVLELYETKHLGEVECCPDCNEGIQREKEDIL